MIKTAVICPSITPSTSDPHVYREQIERVAFAPRVQIDLMDGDFAPNKNINPIQVWWPAGTIADIHLMYRRPAEHIETLVSLRPHTIILHAESEGDIVGYLTHIKKFQIRIGVALLADTPVRLAQDSIAVADHVMLFAGTLGSFGGVADMSVLKKVAEIRSLRPDIEIGWDGGINTDNICALRDGGVNVFNVGSFIQRADDPQAAYDSLVKALS